MKTIPTIPLHLVSSEIERTFGIDLTSLTSDAFADALGLWGSDRWRPFNFQPEEPDLAIWRRIHLIDKLGSRLLVITDLSFLEERGAFEINESEIEEFVGSYEQQFGETFFNGDLIIVAPEARRAWLLHHEGLYITVDAEHSAASLPSKD